MDIIDLVPGSPEAVEAMRDVNAYTKEVLELKARTGAKSVEGAYIEDGQLRSIDPEVD